MTKPGDVAASESNGPYTHVVRNAGSSVFEVLDVELLKRPTKAGSRQLLAKVEAESQRSGFQWTLAPGAMSAMHTDERPYLIISATPLMLKMMDP